MGRVIYLTGAPAAGKSTLCTGLQRRSANLLVFSYSTLLQEHIRQRDGKSISTAELREKSSGIITREEIMEVDATLIKIVKDNRSSHDILIDSHPVTNESYGFRVTSFTTDQLKALSPDSIVCLYASPEVLRDRIKAVPDGRPLPSHFELGLHIYTQAALAAQYSVVVGRSCYLIDSGINPDDLVNTVWPILQLTPH